MALRQSQWREATMPIPSDLENGTQLRIVRRRAIAMVVFYIAATLTLLCAAVLDPTIPPIPGRFDAAVPTVSAISFAK
jgi:hypothetical protein